MVSVKYVKSLLSLSLLSIVTGCVSSTSGPESSQQAPVDIYDQLKNDNVQYSGGIQEVDEKSPEYVMSNMREARAAYFNKRFDDVRKFCNRTLKSMPSTAEAYYWLARVAVDEGDFSQAYAMASKGETLSKEANMKAELGRIKTMTQMGAR